MILSGYLKDIYLVLNTGNTLKYPEWRMQKLKHISARFGIKKLSKIIDELAIIDIKVKTTSANLKDELDLLILRKLE